MRIIIAPVVNITAVPSLPQPVETQAVLLAPDLAVALTALTSRPIRR